MGEQIYSFLNKYISTLSWHRLSVRWEDIVEILIISFLVYQIMPWVKNTTAWFLMKGIFVILLFIFLATSITMYFYLNSNTQTPVVKIPEEKTKTKMKAKIF